jgi:hypothetical protein
MFLALPVWTRRGCSVVWARYRRKDWMRSWKHSAESSGWNQSTLPRDRRVQLPALAYLTFVLCFLLSTFEYDVPTSLRPCVPASLRP